MGSDAARFGIRGVSGGASEGIQTHGVIQLGLVVQGQSYAFSTTFKLSHGNDHPPLYNLALQAPALPTWLSSLAIDPLPTLVPYTPGPGSSAFVPGIAPVGAQGPLPWAPLDPTTAAATAALCGPGGFAFYSNPGAVHQWTVSGSLNTNVDPGCYRYDFYVAASEAPGPSGAHYAKVSIAVQIQPQGG